MVEDWHVLEAYDLPFAFENMDQRKPSGKSVTDMRGVLGNPKLNMVLDLTHVYTIDKTMGLAREFCAAFADRIVEMHFSGYYVHGSDEQQHYPIHLSQQQELLSAASLLDVPIIIESVWPETVGKIAQDDYLVNELRKEYAYIKENIKHSMVEI
jgi:hypothetical protein